MGSSLNLTPAALGLREKGTLLARKARPRSRKRSRSAFAFRKERIVATREEGVEVWTQNTEREDGGQAKRDDEGNNDLGGNGALPPCLDRTPTATPFLQTEFYR